MSPRGLQSISFALSAFPEELTTEKAGFITRANCLSGVAQLIEDNHGLNPHEPIARATVQAMRPKNRRPFPSEAQQLIRIAWQTEMGARFAGQLNEVLLKRVGIQTLPVTAYYALYNAWRAFSLARGAKKSSHRHVHDDFGEKSKKFPIPWNIRLSGDNKSPETCLLEPEIFTPTKMNLLEKSHSSEAFVWGALRMTRKWKIESAREEWLKANKKADGTPRKQQPREARAVMINGLRPTTLFDFMYELRRRVNYETADDYGSDVSDSDIEHFHDGLVNLLDSGMAVIEASLMRVVGYDALEQQMHKWVKGTVQIGSWAAEPLQLRMAALEKINADD